MSTIETAAISRLAAVVKSMDPYTKGRLVGIGEGMALAAVKAEPGDKDTIRRELGAPARETA